jgi:hypothetical protein
MKLLKYFDSFLENTVNLNSSRMELLDQRTTAITNFLTRDEVFGPILAATIPQGSYAQKTIIRPRANGTFDADLLVHLDPVPDWAACEYVSKLYTRLGRSDVYKEMRHRRTRCVYIDYADEFHVDLVPYVEFDGLGHITNRFTDRFERTDPKGITDWLTRQNAIANEHLIKVIRLLKFARDITWGFNVKSLLLTVLVGERIAAFNEVIRPGCYADVPTTHKTVVDDLDAYLQQNQHLPTIIDPGGTGERFNERWDEEGYTGFRDKFHALRAKVDEAFDAQGVDASVTAWQAVFGSEFKTPPVTASATSGGSRGALILVEGARRPVTERFIDRDYGFPIIGSRTLRMIGRVVAKGPLAGYRLLDAGNRVEKDRKLVFEIEYCDVSAPYRVFWKVRNNGLEAQRAGHLRGEISEGFGATHEESTRYAGSHYVECYIVKNARCLAVARQVVTVV